MKHASFEPGRSTKGRSRPARFLRLRFEPLEPRQLLDAGTLYISEFMADNDNTIDDEDGNSSDWIEIHNPTTAPVNLNGWHLSDDAADLTKWQFPSVTLKPNDHLLVFASNKDRRDPQGELHTNFRLDADGEYLALVAPDGVTIAHAYAPAYPPQREDVSFGAIRDASSFFVPESGRITYLVPTPAEAASATTWMQPSFDDSTWSGFTQASRILITEVATPSPRFVEIQNVSRSTVDTSGWVVAVNNGLVFDVNSVHQTLWQLPPSISRDEVLLRTDDPEDGDYYWGEPITWWTQGPGWVMIVDDVGTVVDFVIWGYSDALIAELNVEVNGHAITAADIWAGPSVVAAGSRHNSLQRHGSSDHDTMGDWQFIEPQSTGVANAALLPPFTTDIAIGVGFDATGTGIGSAVQIDVQQQMFAQNASAWIRFPFDVTDPSRLDSLELQLRYNDAFVAYVNGVPVARENAPETLAWNSAATDSRPVAQSLQFEQFDLTAYLGELHAGENMLAIHGLNVAAGDGDFLVLPNLVGNSRRFFGNPTPAAANTTGFRDFVADTKFSIDRGLFNAPIDVEITTDTPGATIYYTLDGSEPTETGAVKYTGPVRIATTTVLRAAAFKEDLEPTDVDTHTYIFLDDVIRQPAWPAGMPTAWGVYTYNNPGQPRPANYGMDPDVVNDPRYRDTIKNDLLAIPTLSLTVDPPDLWDASNGIYSHSLSQGLSWERPGSAELIYPDGSPGFQINAGVRIHGGWGRRPSQNAKHSFRLLFKGIYGPPRLDFPLFGPDAADSFDALVLRAGFNDAWRGGGSNVTYIQDRWAAQTQLDMGGLAPHGTWVHLYLNGLYWGLYNPIERPNAAFAASYLGGEKEDYDAYHTGRLVDGTSAAWNQLFGLIRQNPIDYAAVEGMLDIPAFMDYMILNQFGGNWDWPHNNWYASRRRDPDGKWLFHSWDAEGVLRSVTDNRVDAGGGNSSGEIYFALRRLPQFKRAFADRIHRHLFNDGLLTPAANIARMNSITDRIDRAIVGESARWGDGRLDNVYPPRTRDSHWIPRLNSLRTSYFPQRNNNVIGFYRSSNLYPETNAPVFYLDGAYQHGGEIAAGDRLSISNPNGSGTTYYTLDDTDPWGLDDAPSATARRYTGGTVALAESTIVKARVLRGGEWSALNEATYVVPWTPPLVIGEINYHPHDPTDAELATQPPGATAWENADFEFVELQNTGIELLDLSGMAFTDGIDFQFAPGTTLAPGQYTVVVRNADAFAARYGTGIDVAGSFVGGLDKAGEGIELRDRFDQIVLRFDYDDEDGWPGRADGKGATVELIDPAAVPTDQTLRTEYLQDPDHWRSAVRYGGTPGSDPAEHQGVVVNEVLSHTDWPVVDSIELHNVTAAPIDVAGWYLSDSWGWESNLDNGNYKKYRIPANDPARTVIPAGGYRVFGEYDFNPTPLTPGPYDFALNGAHGDDVWLMRADASGNLTHFGDHAEFGAQENARSWGRWPDVDGGLVPMTEPTFGEPNSGPRLASVVVSEIHYNPGDTSGADDLEFVEIYNAGPAPVDLTDWRLDKAIDYDFPQGTTLGPHAVLVIVPFDPSDVDQLATFRTAHHVIGTVDFAGPYRGQLFDDGERVQLEYPDEEPAGEPGFVPHLLEDEVGYDDDGGWPVRADGSGESLSRLGTRVWGNDPGSWTAAEPTPGLVSFGPEVVGRHVFYNDSVHDGGSSGIDDRDDDAIATDKEALLRGEVASLANYTSYAAGINGIMVDLANLPVWTVPAVGDFLFHVGNDDTPDNWAPAPAPAGFAVRAGAGPYDPARVTITWADNAISNQWLQVTVLAGNLGLPADDVFYFGNAVAESGNTPDDARVTIADLLLARNNPRDFLDSAGIEFPYDYDRDGFVNATDVLLARNNGTSFLDDLELIAPAAASQQSEPIAWEDLAWVAEAVGARSDDKVAGR